MEEKQSLSKERWEEEAEWKIDRYGSHMPDAEVKPVYP